MNITPKPPGSNIITIAGDLSPVIYLPISSCSSTLCSPALLLPSLIILSFSTFHYVLLNCFVLFSFSFLAPHSLTLSSALYVHQIDVLAASPSSESGVIDQLIPELWPSSLQFLASPYSRLFIALRILEFFAGRVQFLLTVQGLGISAAFISILIRGTRPSERDQIRAPSGRSRRPILFLALSFEGKTVGSGPCLWCRSGSVET
jgi:hypothetical protein